LSIGDEQPAQLESSAREPTIATIDRHEILIVPGSARLEGSTFKPASGCGICPAPAEAETIFLQVRVAERRHKAERIRCRLCRSYG
jgi:hypothetical protein